MKTTTFTPVKRLRGSNIIEINVDRDGVPFGQIWTFLKTGHTSSMVHAQPLTGKAVAFDTIAEAKQYMESAR